MTQLRLFAILVPAVLLAACGGSDAANESTAAAGSTAPGDLGDNAPYDGIAADETVKFTGTEPFWGGEVTGDTLTYTTPEDPEGATIAVQRFGGRGGLSYSGEYKAMPFTLGITPGDCSDGMSDRTYPFNATMEVEGQIRTGCAYTAKRSPSGAQEQ
ncbi:hypothetical protein GRI89_01510 [Altererythrobacter salegens]|uniref:Lipoprotein n=1 Tax=Croceibacterium salegens TaxID=1737568 RepID=A0A6I4SQU1_9SPHN|nr:hypothetical protein [Croceibacterium salegens]MXO58223.1 hypothetical protein [Croceibacterium salegens]